ncbi:MAG: hypothetical protein DRH90_17975 [Deltaproteobacteria bacterium]|nr:MAG: hypothetical protein DRH90_17975 [Deltaproteobacteria bacterium]
MSNRPVPNALLALVKRSEIKRFTQDYYEANFALDIIREAIEEKLRKLSDKEENEANFKEPGYMEKYIHILGQRKMAKELLNLFPKKG